MLKTAELACKRRSRRRVAAFQPSPALANRQTRAKSVATVGNAYTVQYNGTATWRKTDRERCGYCGLPLYISPCGQYTLERPTLDSARERTFKALASGRNLRANHLPVPANWYFYLHCDLAPSNKCTLHPNHTFGSAAHSCRF
jgi:hypothetical protein